MPELPSNNNEMKVLHRQDSPTEEGDDSDVCLISDSPYRVFKMAREGNLSEVKRLLTSGKSPLIHDHDGLTALHHAAAGNHVTLVGYLLDQGVDINARDNDGNTPLHTAVAHSAVDVIHVLLNNNADSSLANTKDRAPINYAVSIDAQLSLKALLSHDSVDKNLVDEDAAGPLHYAARFDRSECAAMLLEYGVGMKDRSSNGGYYPIHVAAYHHSSKTLDTILQYATSQCNVTRDYVLSLKDADNHTPLHAAVNSADLEAMRVCLKAGALVDALQDDRSTPVHYACSQGNAAMIAVMLELQTDRMHKAMKIQDGMGMTPLHRAAIFDHTDVVNILIENGAEVDARDAQQRSPLLVAASKGSWNTVYVLVENGADVTIKDINNRNFLHIAIQNGVSLLDFDYGSMWSRHKNQKNDLQKQLNESDISGCTPLHYASKEGFLHVIDDLIRSGASINAKNNDNESPFHFAARYGRYNSCRRLLDSKLGPYVVNEKDGFGRTALHLAAREGHSKIVSLLLQRGCTVMRCYRGNTSLHLAAMNGYTQCMRLMLVVHRNLINSQNKLGNTALDMAAKEGKTSAVTLLLSSEAKITTDHEGLTFFDHIILNRQEEVAKAVIKHERWQEVMDVKSARGTPMIGLIEHLPSVCLNVLDRCQTYSNDDRNSTEFQVTYNFKYLHSGYGVVDDVTEKPQFVDEYEPMKIMNMMVKHGRVDCLSHPVCTNYVKMKWNAYGVWIHMTSLLVYFVFLFFLTWYVVQYRIPDHDQDWGGGLSTNLTKQQIVEKHFKCTHERSLMGQIVLWFLAIFTLLNVLKEFYQMKGQKERYLLDTGNLLEWTLYFSTAVFIVPFLVDHCGSFQWEAGAVAVFLAWFNVLLYLQRFEMFGLYIVMFLEILATLLRVICVFTTLIIAFGLAFFILLGDDQSLKAHIYPGLSMIRTVVMMLELDYMSSFNGPFTDNDPTTLPFPALTLALLLVFIIFMPILLMNLLIGLAVGDIESVQRNARLKRLAMQVELHTDLERKLPRRFLDKVEKVEYVLRPNCSKNKLVMAVMRLTVGLSDDGGKDDVAQSRVQQEIREDLARQKHKLKEMSVSLEKQHDLLRLIVQKMDIKSEADFIDEGAVSDDVTVMEHIKCPSMWTSPRVTNDIMKGSAVVSRWKRSVAESDSGGVKSGSGTDGGGKDGVIQKVVGDVDGDDDVWQKEELSQL